VKSVIVLLYQKVVPQRLCWSWNNIQINQSDLGDKFTIYVKFKLTTRVRWLYISVIIPKIRVKWYVNKLWVGLGLSLRVRNRVKTTLSDNDVPWSKRYVLAKSQWANYMINVCFTPLFVSLPYGFYDCVKMSLLFMRLMV